MMEHFREQKKLPQVGLDPRTSMLSVQYSTNSDFQLLSNQRMRGAIPTENDWLGTHSKQ